jgi:hypothetical protein
MPLTPSPLPIDDASSTAPDALREEPTRRGDAAPVRAALDRLEIAFGQPFMLVDANTGALESDATTDVGWDIAARLPLIAEVARRGRAESVEHESPLSMLVVPLGGLERGASLVAISVFLTMRVERDAQIMSAARVFGVDSLRALAWARHAEVWSTRVLQRLADATLDALVQRFQLDHLQREINEAVAHARDTYAELGLLHRLTRRLALSDDDGQLWRCSAQWLAESVPAQCLAIVPREGLPEVIQGQCPLAPRELADMLQRLGPTVERPLLLNRFHTAALTWGYPTVRELACTPIAEGSGIAAG